MAGASLMTGDSGNSYERSGRHRTHSAAAVGTLPRWCSHAANCLDNLLIPPSNWDLAWIYRKSKELEAIKTSPDV
jgi:hypothetical protein